MLPWGVEQRTRWVENSRTGSGPLGPSIWFYPFCLGFSGVSLRLGYSVISNQRALNNGLSDFIPTVKRNSTQSETAGAQDLSGGKFTARGDRPRGLRPGLPHSTHPQDEECTDLDSPGHFMERVTPPAYTSWVNGWGCNHLPACRCRGRDLTRQRRQTKTCYLGNSVGNNPKEGRKHFQ